MQKASLAVILVLFIFAVNLLAFGGAFLDKSGEQMWSLPPPNDTETARNDSYANESLAIRCSRRKGVWPRRHRNLSLENDPENMFYYARDCIENYELAISEVYENISASLISMGFFSLVSFCINLAMELCYFQKFDPRLRPKPIKIAKTVRNVATKAPPANQDSVQTKRQYGTGYSGSYVYTSTTKPNIKGTGISSGSTDMTSGSEAALPSSGEIQTKTTTLRVATSNKSDGEEVKYKVHVPNDIPTTGLKVSDAVNKITLGGGSKKQDKIPATGVLTQNIPFVKGTKILTKGKPVTKGTKIPTKVKRGAKGRRHKPVTKGTKIPTKGKRGAKVQGRRRKKARRKRVIKVPQAPRKIPMARTAKVPAWGIHGGANAANLPQAPQNVSLSEETLDQNGFLVPKVNTKPKIPEKAALPEAPKAVKKSISNNKISKPRKKKFDDEHYSDDTHDKDDLDAKTTEKATPRTTTVEIEEWYSDSEDSSYPKKKKSSKDTESYFDDPTDYDSYYVVE